MNAMVNKMQGKGFEDVRNYTNLRFHFFDIDNIHIMRSSLNKLLEGILFSVDSSFQFFASVIYLFICYGRQMPHSTQYRKVKQKN